VACIFGTTMAQIQLVQMPTAAIGLTPTCISVLNQPVNCHPSFKWAGKSGKFETDITVANVCTVSCSTGLTTWLRRIESACAGTKLSRSDGYQVLPAYYAQVFIERWNLLCYKEAP